MLFLTMILSYSKRSAFVKHFAQGKLGRAFGVPPCLTATATDCRCARELVVGSRLF